MINVYDLKQYVYCPRVIYWYYCAPVKFHETYKMQWGAEKHNFKTLGDFAEKMEQIINNSEPYKLPEIKEPAKV